MAFTQDFFTSYRDYSDGDTRIGQLHRLWYDSATNTIRVSDGETPGGIVVSGGGSGGSLEFPYQPGHAGQFLTTNGITVSWASISGLQGPKGDTGDQGIQGIQGPAGDQGPKGDTGDQGIQGIQGPAGDQGIQGPAGDQGIQGPAGIDGGVIDQNQSDWTQGNISSVDYIKNKPSIPSTLTDLTDVTLLSPSAGQVLKYNGSQWINDTDLTDSTGGSTPGYYGSFYDNQTQTLLVANTPTEILLRSAPVGLNGVTIISDSRITITYTGVYNLQFSFQLYNQGGGGNGQTVFIWLRKNGIDVPDSSTEITVPTNSPYTVAAWNFIFPCVAGDYFEIMWTANNHHIVIQYVQPTTTWPGTPSAIVTVQQVSATMTGPQGPTGQQGIQGIQGIQGPAGTDGSQGPKGDTGATGLKGDTGDTGPQGEAPPTYLYTADSISLTNGVFIAGAVSDIQTFNDGLYFNFTDGTHSGPAWQVDVGFINIIKFNRILMNINYTQNSGHTVYVQLYNYLTSTWDSVGSYTGLQGYYQFALEVLNSTNYILLGTAVVKLYHNNTGNALHETRIDYVALEQSTQGGQGPKGATGSTGPIGPQGPVGISGVRYDINNQSLSTEEKQNAITNLGLVSIVTVRTFNILNEFAGPITGTAVFVPVSAVTITVIQLTVGLTQTNDLTIGLYKNNILLDYYSIPTGEFTVTYSNLNFALTTSDRITIDIISGSGVNLSIALMHSYS